MELLVPRCAGLDVAKDEVVACVRLPDGRGGPARRCGRSRPSPRGLEALADWLTAEGVTQVVMEATGQYWKPVWYVLEEAGFELLLVNARHVKILPGRKTDVCDAAWLAELLEHGLLRGSFVPPAADPGAAGPDPLPQAADPGPHRGGPADPEDPGGRRHQAGLGRRRRARGVRAGRCWPRWSPASATPGCWPSWPGAGCAPSSPSCARRCGAGSVPTTRCCRLALEHLEQLEAHRIAELDTAESTGCCPVRSGPGPAGHHHRGGQAGGRVHHRRDRGGHGGVPHRRAPGVVGRGRCPGNNLTGGKRRSGKPTKGNRWLGEVLIECAWAAARSRDTYLSAQYWRLARRIGKKKAAVAVGHSILVIAWHLLTDNCDYRDLGGDYFARRDTERQRQRAVAQLQALGYRVVLEPAAA